MTRPRHTYHGYDAPVRSVFSVYVHTRTGRKRRNSAGTNCEQLESRHTTGPIEGLPNLGRTWRQRRTSRFAIVETHVLFFARLEALIRRFVYEWVNERRSVTRMRKKTIMETASFSLCLSLEPGTRVYCDHVIYFWRFNYNSTVGSATWLQVGFLDFFNFTSSFSQRRHWLLTSYETMPSTHTFAPMYVHSVHIMRSQWLMVCVLHALS